MADLDVVRDLISDRVLVLTEHDEHGRNVLVLNERESQGRCSLTIRRVPDGTVAIRAEELAEPRFRGDRGENRRADFVIVASTTKKSWLVYIEMARGKKALNEVQQQLMGARCIVAYCRAIAREFWQEQEFLRERDYQQRFVSVGAIGINKRPTRHRQRDMHDKPDSLLRIGAPGRGVLSFGDLVGGVG